MWDYTLAPDDDSAETIALQRTLTRDLANYCRQGSIFIVRGVEDISLEDQMHKRGIPESNDELNDT